MSSFKILIKSIPVVGPLLKKLNTKKAKPVNGLNNVIVNNGKFNNVTFDIIGNNNSISVGRFSVIENALFFIRGNNHRIVIGDECFFGGGEMWIEDVNGSIIIQDRTTIEQAHLAVTEPGSVLEIKEDCMLSKHIEIRTGDSHSIIDRQSGKRINPAGNVTLQEHVWVGAHSIILKGVTIGNNTIIGTASLVTTDVPPYCIAAGVPAKVIRENTDWKRERIW